MPRYIITIIDQIHRILRCLVLCCHWPQRQIRESKFRDSPKSHHSDIFAIAHLWCSWRTASESGEGANLCDARNLSSGILLRIDNTRLAILRFMQAYGLIQQSEVRSLDQDHPESDTPWSEMSALLSPQSANYPLLSALLATVANPNVAVRKSHRLFQTKCDKVSRSTKLGSQTNSIYRMFSCTQHLFSSEAQKPKRLYGLDRQQQK